MLQERIAQSLREHNKVFEETFLMQASSLAGFADQVVDAFNRGGRLLIIGSGALGAVSDLVANLFLHRLSLERPPLPALSLCQNTTLASALAKEGKENQFFPRQLRVIAGEKDIILVFWDLDRHEVLEEILAEGRRLGCSTALVLQGKGELTGETPDLLFPLASDSLPRGVEASVFFGHLLCELVEKSLFGI
jgi:D-sedoheptulose 7-phosphate isomerase